MLGCARREVREETGLDVDPGQCAFVLETIDSSGEQRVIEVVFLSPDRPACADLLAELADHGPAPVRRTTGHLLDGDDQDGGDQGGDERGEVGE